jgi:hypothetical protein
MDPSIYVYWTHCRCAILILASEVEFPAEYSSMSKKSLPSVCTAIYSNLENTSLSGLEHREYPALLEVAKHVVQALLD